MSHYIVIENTDLNDFQDDVNEKIKLGYRPTGPMQLQVEQFCFGLLPSDTTYIQAMVKEAP